MKRLPGAIALACLLLVLPVHAQAQAKKYPALPRARVGQQAAAVGGKVYIVGGLRESEGGGPARNATNLAIFDPDVRRWQTGPEMPHPRNSFGMAVVSGNLYVAGGETDDGLTASVVMYDTRKRKWSDLPDLPEPRYQLAAVRLKEKLYVVGGGSKDPADTALCRKLYLYDTEAEAWVPKADLPFPMRKMGAGAIDGKLYVVGGNAFEGTENQGNLTLEYDPATDTWQRMADMPTPRTDVGIAVFTGELYVIGGQPGLATVEVFNPSENTWREAPDLPEGRSSASAVSFGEEILLVGGTPNHTYSYLPPELVPQ